MNEAMQSRAAEDLAVARSLAEQGRRAPLVGGGIYVVWGAATALCLVCNWAIQARILPLSPWAIPVVWFAGMGGAGFVSGMMRSRLAEHPGAVGIGNSVSRAVWTASGAFLSLFALALFFTLLLAPKRVLGFEAPGGVAIGFAFSIFLPVSFGVYAVAMAATAEAAQSGLFRTFSAASFVAMIATASLIGRPEQLLVGAAAALLVLSAPGVILMRSEAKG